MAEQDNQVFIREAIREMKVELAREIELQTILTHLYANRVISEELQDEIEALERSRGRLYAAGELLQRVIKGQIEASRFVALFPAAGQEWIKEQIDQAVDKIQTGNMKGADTTDQAFEHEVLCSKCLLSAADATLEDQKFIDTFVTVSREIYNKFGYHVISPDAADQCSKILSDSEANVRFRQALKRSLHPEKIDVVLDVLEQHFQRDHAERIRTCYNRVIREHKASVPCDQCPTEK